MTRFRPLWFEQFEPRLLLTAGVPPVSEAMPIAQIRLELSDLAGQPISSAHAGEEFFLNAYVADLRSEPQGVFAAYLDLAFDAARVVPAGDVEFGSVYKNGLNNGGSVPGLLDEVGGFSGIRSLGAGDFLLFRAPFRAEAAGPISFLAEPATSMPRSVVLLYGEYAPLASDQIRFGSASLDVLGPQDSSVEDIGSPAGGSFNIGSLDLSSPPGDLDSPDVPPFLPRILLTGMGADLLLQGATSALGTPRALDLRTDRVWDSQAEIDFLNLAAGFTDGFNFAARSQSLEWQNRGAFIELVPKLPVGRSFSMMEVPDFLFDDYDAGPGSDWAEDLADRPTAWTPLFHDHQWLTAGLLSIGWTTELERREDADLAGRDEMLDLSQVAYEMVRTTHLRDAPLPQIHGDDDEKWIASLDWAFSEQTEIEPKQGTMMALDVGASPRTSPSQKAKPRRDSGEAAPTNTPDNKRADDNPERKTHDDTTPAA